MPSVMPKLVKVSKKAEDMLQFDLGTRQRPFEATARARSRPMLNEFAIAESLRGMSRSRIT
jgi:hypothetical protein